MNAAFELVSEPKVTMQPRLVGRLATKVRPEIVHPTTDSVPYMIRDIIGFLRQEIRSEVLRKPALARPEWLVTLYLELLPGSLALLWKTVVGHLAEGGLEAGQCRKLFEVALEALDAGLESMNTARTLAMDAADATKRPLDGLERLGSAITEAEVIREKVLKVLEQASAPHRPVDEQKLEESEAAFAEGNYTSLEDYIASRRSGSR